MNKFVTTILLGLFLSSCTGYGKPTMNEVAESNNAILRFGGNEIVHNVKVPPGFLVSSDCGRAHLSFKNYDSPGHIGIKKSTVKALGLLCQSRSYHDEKVDTLKTVCYDPTVSEPGSTSISFTLHVYTGSYPRKARFVRVFNNVKTYCVLEGTVYPMLR